MEEEVRRRGEQQEASSRWRLAALFARLFGLPAPQGLMRHLASRDDWVSNGWQGEEEGVVVVVRNGNQWGSVSNPRELLLGPLHGYRGTGRRNEQGCAFLTAHVCLCLVSCRIIAPCPACAFGVAWQS